MKRENSMFYRVKAKCGHVGRNHYIEKNFYVIASSGKEAALRVRYLPRVKHDRKDAILNVEQISQDEFNIGIEINRADNYFKVTNSSEQRLLEAVDSKDIRQEPRYIEFKKERNINYILKRKKILAMQYDKMLVEAIHG